MILTALPDWSRPLDFADGRGYFLFHRDAFAVVPNSAIIPATDLALPEISLQFLRSAIPFSASSNYAVLSVALEPILALQSARSHLAQIGASAGVQGVDLTDGLARFRLPDMIAQPELQDELEALATLGSAGIKHKLIMRLTETTGLFWRELILANTMLVKAHILYRVTGVAPRSAHRVRFNPVTLLEHLGDQLTDSAGIVVLDDLEASLIETLASWPIEIDESLSAAGLARFAECFKDHLVAKFAKSPSLSDADQLVTVFRSVSEVGAGEFEWDLSGPITATRLFQVDSSPFDTWQNQLSEEQRLQLIQVTSLPFIREGLTPFQLYTNIGMQADSLLAAGAHIRQSAAPPDRPQELIKTLDVLADHGQSRTDLFVDRDGTLEYTYQGFVAIQTNIGVIELHGEEKVSNEHILVLNPGGFAMQTVELELQAVWRGEIDVLAELYFLHDGKEHKITQQLNDGNYSATLVLPIGSEQQSLWLTLTELNSGHNIREEIASSGHTAVGPLLFKQCGPQGLQVSGTFSDELAVLAVELLPRGIDPELTDPHVLHLTPGQPEKFWQWVVQSPFLAGYQYRLLDSLGNPDSDWTMMDYPFADLQLGNTNVTNVSRAQH